jgi:dihydrofolate reductase
VIRPFKAIAAMSLNRVIGNENKIPWHLPEDFKFFKKMTTGHVIVMGRKTFESIGRPLPNRTTIVLTRGSFSFPGVQTCPGLAQLTADPAIANREVFICGGSQIYEQALPSCSDLYLTLVNRKVAGDTFFPPFENAFELKETLQENPEFKIFHYQHIG